MEDDPEANKIRTLAKPTPALVQVVLIKALACSTVLIPKWFVCLPSTSESQRTVRVSLSRVGHPLRHVQGTSLKCRIDS
jgi:hypothetical protein